MAHRLDPSGVEPARYLSAVGGSLCAHAACRVFLPSLSLKTSMNTLQFSPLQSPSDRNAIRRDTRIFILLNYIKSHRPVFMTAQEHQLPSGYGSVEGSARETPASLALAPTPQVDPNHQARPYAEQPVQPLDSGGTHGSISLDEARCKSTDCWTRPNSAVQLPITSGMDASGTRAGSGNVRARCHIQTCARGP
ncbi:hypothetical protein FA95DRAFT_1684888 [Auriscalpium vulgare]|uniref:Uncharacterized protein n=1 Tax=Auriscalpium vulgare TaxID=40419 RepID=A0ACB8R0T1_9AGAM|nr:hypothetical protein FA95DRAFT_1684888 [Auriscalpium vulgare]